MKTLLNVKRRWDALTSCFSSCSIRACLTQKSSHLKWLTLSSPLLILSLLLSQSSGAQTQETALETYQLLDYLEIISTVQCSSKETGTLTTTQSARLTRRVVDRMKRSQLISHNATVFCTCTKCVLTETDTATVRSWTF